MIKYGCLPAVVSRAEEVPDLVDERLLVVLRREARRKLSGVPRGVDPVDLAADTAVCVRAGQKDCNVS